MIKFNDWLKINEETREERRLRELEAMRREQERLKRLAQREEDRKIEKALGYSDKPKTTKDLLDLMTFRQKFSSSSMPSADFAEKVWDNIEKQTVGRNPRGEHGFSHLYDFPDNPKGESDFSRLHEMLHDLHDDGTSEQEATIMAIDVLKQMGYIR